MSESQKYAFVIEYVGIIKDQLGVNSELGRDAPL